ncbi:TrfB-related DNA-binding protein [Pseudomonas helleri]|uniref:TrfB-related DNA-binding protein n=1 Tax=Pseudomonas helleri TaxID=1608996 RepID=UPI003FD3F01A
MTEAQFAKVVEVLSVSAQTLEVAHGVLVLGKSQAYYAQKLKLTAGAISQAVNRVWTAFMEQSAVPSGYERVTAILPAHQAFIVKKWQQATKKTKP